MALQNIKNTLSNSLEKVKESGKKVAITLATVGALSGVLTSCDNKEISVDMKNKEVSAEFVFQSGGSDPEVFDVSIQKQGTTYVAEIDGPFWDNKEFGGTKEEVFSQVEDFLVEKAMSMSRDPENLPNIELAQKVETKMGKMRVQYDEMLGNE